MHLALFTINWAAFECFSVIEKLGNYIFSHRNLKNKQQLRERKGILFLITILCGKLQLFKNCTSEKEKATTGTSINYIYKVLLCSKEKIHEVR